MKGHEAVADYLLRSGVRVLHGLLGNTNLAFAAVLCERGGSFVSSRHESAAVGMAAGAGWATGTVGVCTVTHGPGLSNALTAITSAVRDRLPVLVITGDIASAPGWNAQRADHAAMLQWTGAGFIHCRSPRAIAASLAAGFSQAAAQRRPVVVNIDAEVLAATAAEQDPPAPDAQASGGGAPPEPPPVDRAQLDAALAILRGASRPVVLAGRGVSADCAARLRRLAAHCGALLTTTLPARGCFEDDPFHLGVCGGFSTRGTRALLQSADAVVAFGAGLNGFTTLAGRMFAAAKVVHCDVDTAARGRWLDTAVFLRGDAMQVAGALLEGLPTQREGWRTPELAARIAQTRAGAGYEDFTGDAGLDPRFALLQLDALLPRERQVVTDVGHFGAFPSQAITVPGHGRFLPSIGFGAVGLGIGPAIGAALANGCPTFAFVGDGGTLMAFGELETLARTRAPLTLVVMNDSAYGAEIRHLHNHGLPGTVAQFPSCDFAGVARALGIEARTLRAAADIEAMRGTDWASGPRLLDLRITLDTPSDFFESH